MGSLTSTLALAGNALSTLNQANNLAANARNTFTQSQQRQAELDQLKAQQAADVASATREAELEKLSIEADRKSNEDQRQAALRRAVSRQRAISGARGLSPEDGSAGAVLLGLFEESDLEKQERERVDQLRSKALDNQLADIRQRNVLELQDLRTRQRFNRGFL